MFWKKKSAEDDFNRGYAYYTAGELHKAVREFTKAIAKGSIIAAYQRGLAYGKLGRLQQAIQDFENVIDCNPTGQLGVDVNYNCGLAYEKLNQIQYYEKAIQCYDKAIALKPELANAYCNQGAVYTKLGLYEQAVKSLDKAIAINPRDAIAYFNRAIAYDHLGKPGETIKNLEAFLGIAPRGHPHIKTAEQRLEQLRDHL